MFRAEHEGFLFATSRNRVSPDLFYSFYGTVSVLAELAYCFVETNNSVGNRLLVP